ncbi:MULTISPECIES: PhzF family phenazine biosynthesis protein [unclassified Streptomyces]|uniref:PhzF family phenazine biosynthesis protein n=1 Tax=unclassified Streptomyces TaxID=2593676 RepID=UPI0007CF8EF1|nr:PhzF family phenazine biosynthesis protein [Streptomyces sp. FXJ1.172]WEO99182.1 PhzF family phenazine biosynthesis protein [Streptomyces sp. FXJ1.172]
MRRCSAWRDQLATAKEVLGLEPDLSLIPDAMVGAIGAYPEGSEYDFELRIFAPGAGVHEDPACGSMNAAVGQWLTLLRADDLTVFPVTDPAGTIVSVGRPGLVDTVLVASRVVKRDGALVDVDLPALKTRILESRDRIATAAGIPLDGTWDPQPGSEYPGCISGRRG